jgi:tripartite-type tricarboxylate transporter receptor subunit TctC
MVLVVNSTVRANTVPELVALARGTAGGINCATAGVGASHHLAAEVFRLATKSEFTYIHYKGAAPALLDLVAGRIEMMFVPLSSSIQHIKSGRLRALGVTTPRRVAAAPDLPTIAESGVPGYEARAWYGLVAPAKVDKRIVTKLNAEIDHALRTDLGERLAAIGAMPAGGTAEEFGSFIEREVRKYAEVVKAAGIAPH